MRVERKRDAGDRAGRGVARAWVPVRGRERAYRKRTTYWGSPLRSRGTNAAPVPSRPPPPLRRPSGFGAGSGSDPDSSPDANSDSSSVDGFDRPKALAPIARGSDGQLPAPRRLPTVRDAAPDATPYFTSPGSGGRINAGPGAETGRCYSRQWCVAESTPVPAPTPSPTSAPAPTAASTSAPTPASTATPTGAVPIKIVTTSQRWACFGDLSAPTARAASSVYSHWYADRLLLNQLHRNRAIPNVVARAALLVTL